MLEAPDEHGPDPISAVHEVELIDVVEHAWTDALAAGHDPSRPLLPDTFLLREYAGGWRWTSCPRRDEIGSARTASTPPRPIVAGTYEAARAAVDIALTALDRVLAGAPLAYGLCRPPGHHAGRNLIGGYCFFNNAAIVAEASWRAGRDAVAILDVDFHHGNGTQQIFWERGDVLYVSLHGDPRGIYPYYSGYATERGAGRRRGRRPSTCRSRPGPMATPTSGPRRGAGRHPRPSRPMRPSSSPSASTPTTPTRSATSRSGPRTTRASARPSRRSDMPVVALQEGGYAIDALGANAAAFLGALGGTEGARRRPEDMRSSAASSSRSLVGLSACGALGLGGGLTCGGASFSADVLEGRGGAENGADPASTALREHLATSNIEIDSLPDAGWIEVSRTGDASCTSPPCRARREAALRVRGTGWRRVGG